MLHKRISFARDGTHESLYSILAFFASWQPPALLLTTAITHRKRRPEEYRKPKTQPEDRPGTSNVGHNTPAQEELHWLIRADCTSHRPTLPESVCSRTGERAYFLQPCAGGKHPTATIHTLLKEPVYGWIAGRG
jgi:hypothetical protein